MHFLNISIIIDIVEPTQTEEPTGAELLQAKEDATKAMHAAWFEWLDCEVEDQKAHEGQYRIAVQTYRSAELALQEYKDSK